MKKMTIVLIFLSMFLFVGCGDYYYYDYNELVSSVKQIYIVEVERSEYYGDISIEYLKEIKGEEFINILEELSNLRYEYSIFLSPKNNSGKSIMLIYDEENYGIVGLNGIEKFKNNEQVYFYNAVCNEDEFIKILSNHIEQ